MTRITIDIPDHQPMSLNDIGVVLRCLAETAKYVEEGFGKTLNALNKSCTYKTDEGHLFIPTIGDCVYKIERDVEGR
jgi:hypothetical protein